MLRYWLVACRLQLHIRSQWRVSSTDALGSWIQAFCNSLRVCHSGDEDLSVVKQVRLRSLGVNRAFRFSCLFSIFFHAFPFRTASSFDIGSSPPLFQQSRGCPMFVFVCTKNLLCASSLGVRGTSKSYLHMSLNKLCQCPSSCFSRFLSRNSPFL